MVPLVLKIKNFLSYSSTLQSIDFQPYPVVCLSGKNGHGKSALLDALTWAIWGQARKTVATAKPDQGLLRIGQNRMQVQLDFLSCGQVYRVMRDFYSSGGRTVSGLELQIRQEDGTFRPLTDKTIRDTQNKIISIIKLDFDTFLNTSFFRQNSSNEFSRKTPRERKSLIANIIGLDRYDKMSAKASELSRALENQLSQIQAVQVRLMHEIRQKAELEIKRFRAGQELQTLEAELKNIVATLPTLEAGLAMVCGKLQQHECLIAELRNLAKRRLAWRQAIIANQNYNNDTLLQERDAVCVELKQLDNTGQLYAECTQKILNQTRELAAIRTGAVEEISERRRTRAEELEKLKESIMEDAGKLEAQKAKIEAYRIEEKRIQTERASLEKQLTELEQAKLCPTCGQNLPLKTLEKILESCQTFQTKLLALVEQSCVMHRQLSEIETSVEKGLECLIRGKADYSTRLAGYKAEFCPEATARFADQACSSKSLEIAALQSKLVALGEASARQTKLLTSLGEIDSKLRAIQETKTQDLEQKLQLQAFFRESALLAQKLHDRAAENSALNSEKAELETLIAQTREKIENYKSRHQTTLGEIAVQDSELLRLGKVEKEIHASQTEVTRIKTDATDFSLLADAYGKNGIQALLIDSVIPEIEAEANRLLTRLSDNSAKIFIESLRDKKGGGFRESLDIKIVDSAGVRPYEMFSGGEAFRIDFALRIGISKLLATRAGASLQTLIIDEGFGSQDAEGLARLLESIVAIKDDFKKIIIVSHLAELKDEFPVHFIVRKNNAGSTISVEERF